MYNFINKGCQLKKLDIYLEQEFKNMPLVPLSYFTKKIALASKVRTGKSLTTTDYDEVALSNTDIYGVVQPYSRGEDLGLASEKALETQSLKEGDILISYRGQYGFRVGRVGDSYKRAIVSTNSNIRIQFKDDIDKEIPVLIQAYLELPAIQEYLTRCSASRDFSRKLLNAEILSTLPIPHFTERSDSSFTQYHNKQLELQSVAQRLSTKTRVISERIKKSADEDLALYFSDSDELQNRDKDNRELLEVLEGLLEEVSGVIQ